MDYTLMIIASSGNGTTSQLRSFPTKTLADRVAEQVEEAAKKSHHRIEVIKLYLKEGV